MAIDQPWAAHVERNSIGRNPSKDVRQQVAVIGQIVAAEAPVDICWQVRHAGIAVRAQHQAGNVGLGNAHPRRFGRIDRKRRDEGERDRNTWIGPHGLQRTPEREHVGLFKPAQNGVPLAAAGYPKVRVSGCTSGALSAEIRGRRVRPEQIGQREVGARIAPFVIETGSAGRDQSAAVSDEAFHGGTLRIGQRGHTRQHQRRKAAGIAFDMVGVYRQVRQARADQGLGHAAIGRVHQFGRFVAPIVIRIALRPHHPDAGDRLAVDQVLLVLLVPAKDGLRGAVSTTVLVPRADVVPPGLYASGDSRDHPHTRLVRRLGRQPECGTPRLVQRHALRHELVPTEQAVYELAGVAVLLEAGFVGARLVIE